MPTTGWDHWIRRDASVGGRACVAPEVPRTRHIATHGTNVNEAEQRKLAAYGFAEGGASGGFGDLSYLLGATYDAALRASIGPLGSGVRLGCAPP